MKKTDELAENIEQALTAFDEHPDIKYAMIESIEGLKVWDKLNLREQQGLMALLVGTKKSMEAVVGPT
jgi:hypothetical protein